MQNLDEVIARRREAQDAFDAYNALPERVAILAEMNDLDERIAPLQAARSKLVDLYYNTRYDELDMARSRIDDGVIACEGRLFSGCEAITEIPAGFGRTTWTCPACRGE